jgi:HSP20 family molecular chaperone IbpA
VLPDGSRPASDAVDGVDPEQLARSLGLRPPFRAEAVRRSASTWAVGARAITVAELPGVSADELEIVWDGTERAVRIDGEPSLSSIPELERLAARRFDSWVARARRLDERLWEVEVEPL